MIVLTVRRCSVSRQAYAEDADAQDAYAYAQDAYAVEF
jgi:hypothetical protein